MNILRLVQLFGLLPSLDNGESGAQARLAFRIFGRSALKSVATSLWQFPHECRFAKHITPWRPGLSQDRPS
jgi:hypothetical protein